MIDKPKFWQENHAITPHLPAWTLDVLRPWIHAASTKV